MALIWSFETILTFTSTIPVILASIVGFSTYAKQKQRSFIFFAINCLFSSFAFFIYAIAKLVNDLSIAATYAPIFGVLSAVAIVFYVDAMSRDTVDPVKLVILTFCSTGAVFFQNYYFLIGLQVFSMIIWMYYAVKIHQHAPSYAKSQSRLNLIGVIIFVMGSLWGSLSYAVVLISPGDLLSMLNVLMTYIPWYLIVGFAYILIVIAFTRMPIIVSILPFTAIQLSVVDMVGGIALFSHNWVKRDDLMDENLFSGMLSGIGMILNESTKQGDVREIELDNAKLILKKSEPHQVAFVLIASKSTKSLRISLKSFADKFIDGFSKHFGKSVDTSKFIPAAELVKNCFPFAVDYTLDEA
jgi:hypothetical protein